MRVLIVDDDDGVLATLDMVFGMIGGETVHASCGAEALAFVASQSFDLIVMDINMPGMSGIDVLRQLRETPETSQIPVMMLSGESESEFRHQALKLGATEYLSKPFDLWAFRQAVDRVCTKESQLNATGAEVEGLAGLGLMPG